MGKWQARKKYGGYKTTSNIKAYRVGYRDAMIVGKRKVWHAKMRGMDPEERDYYEHRWH